MLLTPLYVQAQNLNQWVTDSLYFYRNSIYWDKHSHQFGKETRKRHILPWLFVNFFIIGVCLIPFCMAFLFNSLLTRASKPASALQWLFAADQITIGTGIALTAVAYLRWTAEMVSSMNTIILLEGRLSRKYSRYCKKFYTTKRKPNSAQFTHNHDKALGEEGQLVGKEVDVAGILANFIVISITVMGPFIPWTLMWLDLDFMILPFRHLVPNLNFSERIIFHGLRIITVSLAITEACLCCRTFPVNVLVIFRGLQKCQILFLSQPIGEAVLKELGQLCVLFAVIRDWLAFLLFTYLTLIYFCMVICTVVILTNAVAVPWDLYVIVVLGWIMAMSWTSTLMFLVVSVDSDSKKLNNAWMYSCSTQLNSTRRRLLYKTMKSFKPIGIPFGSLGTFTRVTRTYYFHTFMVNSINAIIALK